MVLVAFIFFGGFYYFHSLDKPIRIAMEVNRFEKELFSINKDNVENKSNKWNEKFGSFHELFASKILRVSFLDKQYYNSLLEFTQNKQMREAYDSTALFFSDFSEIKDGLDQAFSNFRTYFPSFPIPKITTFFGGFNYGVIAYDDNIGIGLENFLGKRSKYYKLLGDPEYLRFQKQKKFILSNVMEVWFDENFQEYSIGKDLLSRMIYKGKMMYFLNAMLPDLPMEDKFRFTKKQMKWVEENEANIWEYFVQEDLLFSKKESKFRSFISYAPFAKGMPNESPDRVAFFIGYKLVNAHMKNNNNNIEEIIYLTNSTNFLAQSRYKPNK